MRNFGWLRALLLGSLSFGLAGPAVAQSLGLFAQAYTPDSEPFVVWLIQCLGITGLVTLSSGVAIFVGACLVVFLARRPAVIASYLVFLPFPVLFSATWFLKSIVAVLSAIAISGAQLAQAELCRGLSDALVLPVSALMVTIPSYCVLAIGLFIRTLLGDTRPTTNGRKAEQP